MHPCLKLPATLNVTQNVLQEADLLDEKWPYAGRVGYKLSTRFKRGKSSGVHQTFSHCIPEKFLLSTSFSIPSQRMRQKVESKGVAVLIAMEIEIIRVDETFVGA